MGPTACSPPHFSLRDPLTWACRKVLGGSISQLPGPEFHGVAAPEQWGAVGLVQLCKGKGWQLGNMPGWVSQSLSGSVIRFVIHFSLLNLDPEKREKNLPQSSLHNCLHQAEGALDLEPKDIIVWVSCATSGNPINLSESQLHFVKNHSKRWF